MGLIISHMNYHSNPLHCELLKAQVRSDHLGLASVSYSELSPMDLRCVSTRSIPLRWIRWLISPSFIRPQPLSFCCNSSPCSTADWSPQKVKATNHTQPFYKSRKQQGIVSLGPNIDMENPAFAEHLPKETLLFHLVPLTPSKSRCFRVTFWMCFKRPASSWRKAWTASPNFPSSCWLVHNFGQDLRKTRVPRGLGSQDRVAAGLIHQKHGTPYVYMGWLYLALWRRNWLPKK